MSLFSLGVNPSITSFTPWNLTGASAEGGQKLAVCGAYSAVSCGFQRGRSLTTVAADFLPASSFLQISFSGFELRCSVAFRFQNRIQSNKNTAAKCSVVNSMQVCAKDRTVHIFCKKNLVYLEISLSSYTERCTQYMTNKTWHSFSVTGWTKMSRLYTVLKLFICSGLIKVCIQPKSDSRGQAACDRGRWVCAKGWGDPLSRSSAATVVGEWLHSLKWRQLCRVGRRKKTPTIICLLMLCFSWKDHLIHSRVRAYPKETWQACCWL